jgi:ABC-type transport system involved in multi-copper enzyme maturation permease subunit
VSAPAPAQAMNAAPATPPATGRPLKARAAQWPLWRRQLGAVLRLELRKSFLGKRALGIYLLALTPVITFGIRALAPGGLDHPQDVSGTTTLFANFFQSLILRLVVFFGCVEIFGNLIRREMLDRTLHYYFLAPVRREVLAAGKYLTALLVSIVLFGASTALSFGLAYLPHDQAALTRFLAGPGLGHLAAYLGVVALACLGYGAVFLTFGFFSKSPAIPAIAVFGWEALNFLLPPLLKKVSVIHYLLSLCPVPISQGPLAVLADPASPWVAVPGLLAVTALLLWISARKVRRMEISYEEH